MTHYKEALAYAASQLDRLDAEYALRNEALRMPIERDFVLRVIDYVEEYGQDNDLPEGWYLQEADEEETAYKVAELCLTN